jgi:NitT/TauT family transport system ATP-binding protein
MKKPIIIIESLAKTHPRSGDRRRTEVLRDINLKIHEGEFMMLLGPSGCGKSTLLRILAGLDTPTRGRVVYGEGYDPKRVGFVFQNFGILPWLTVFQNVEIGLIGAGVPAHDRARRVHSMLGKLGLSAFRDSKPFELSGGMRQRVGIARAFVVDPKVIFLDEPFSELDFFTAKTLREVLVNLAREQGATVVMVSHYIEEAVLLADTIAVFSNRPSVITASVSDMLSKPRDARSPEFFAKEDEVLSHFEARA